MRVELKRHAPWVLALAVYALNPSVFAQTFVTPRGEAQNVRFEQREEGIVHIFYDLISSEPRAVFSVRVEASSDGGATFGMRPQSATGDVGDGVTPGIGKRIVWESGKDVERVQLDRFRFRIIATGGPLALEPAAPPPRAPATVARGTLAISTTPAGAQVTIDGTPRGVSPLTLTDLTPGAHRVTVSSEGYLENRQVVEVVAEKEERLDVALTVDSRAAPAASAKSAGGGRAKWLIPVVAGGGLAAALGARGRGATPTTSAQPTSAAPGATPPVQCSYSVSPTSFTLALAGGSTQSVNVSTTANCTWAATSNASFLGITGTASFTGSNTVTFSADTNTSGSSRTGTLSVAGQFVNVTQIGPGPDTVTVTSYSPPSGSTLPAGSAANGPTATVSYFLGSRETAFICVQPVVSLPGTECGPRQVTRGSGTVAIRFSVQASAANLPFTTTRVVIFMGDSSQFGATTFLTVSESATFNWTRP